MRNLPLPVVDLQLSSPIPSPSRQSTPSSDTENTLHTLTDTSHADIPVSDNIDITTSQPTTPKSAVPSLQIDLPAVKNTSLYPLASKPTPIPLKRFFFQLDGKPSLFEEIPVKVTHPERDRPLCGMMIEPINAQKYSANLLTLLLKNLRYQH
ncbi:hypothetical protein BDB01DRAFT_133122 [Pilobolus umbonatus]|nr:hypothetical protein BDB01DRAFT_133122 [Pilobolus umbonatus]